MGRARLLAACAVLCVVFAAPGLCPAAGGERMAFLSSITARSLAKEGGSLGGLAYDKARGRLYVCDPVHGRIVALGPDFKPVAEFSAGGSLQAPTAVATDGKGRFYVAEAGRGRVVCCDTTSKSVRPLDLGGGGADNPPYPAALALDAAGRLHVLDRANQRVLVFGKDLTRQTVMVLDARDGAQGMAVDGQGYVYTVGAVSARVSVRDASGKLLRRFGERGAGRGGMRFPVAVAVDARGLVYVLDGHRGKVLAFDREGVFRHEFAQPGWREGRLRRPVHLLAGEDGRVFVVDVGNERINVFE